MRTGGLTDLAGRVLAGRYRLLAPIGTGASGRVYVAWDRDPALPAPIDLPLGAPRDLYLVPSLTQLTLPLDADAEREVGPLVVVPEPDEKDKALEPSAARQRDVPSLPAPLLVLALAGLALAARRRG
jgi:hypothetical protein